MIGFATPAQAAPNLPGLLRELGACSDAISWCPPASVADERSWNLCPHGDWLLWLVARIGVDRRLVVAAACSCAVYASQFWAPHTVEANARCIEVTLCWCDGDETIDEVRQARADAADAADTSDAAAYAAAYATDADTADAAYYAATYAATYAADAAAYAAYAASYATDAARSHAHLECARRVRDVIPWPIVEAALVAYLAAKGVAA